MNNPASHYFQVQLDYSKVTKDSIDFKMPVWTPGYYQILDYADNVENFSAAKKNGAQLTWRKIAKNTWRVYCAKSKEFILQYDVKADVPFVAKNFLDETHGYISPAGLFLHEAGQIQKPVIVSIVPYKQWSKVATGLEPVAGQQYQYTAPNFDVLYDSPILIGNLEELPSFMVKGIPHKFVGYQLGEFDKKRFIGDLKKIVESASDLIGHIPYKHYTFIAIGPGNGGIEHLNSTAISFAGTGLNDEKGRRRLLDFIAHEYFHHYNTKRIRPVELGPFDYDKENQTNMLWVAEGATVYYEYLVLRKAGLINGEDVINSLRNHLISIENKSGRLFQSATQASFQTWVDGPFGRTEEEFNKTISVYDKGTILSMLLDFKIRAASGNKKSLDDVMRSLYKDFYLKKNRGYTEKDFWVISERMAGEPLSEIAEYTSTVKPIDYPKYFAYAGLSIDTTATEVPGAYTGFSVIQKGDSLVISEIDWNSPSWIAGLRKKDILIEVNGRKATKKILEQALGTANAGEPIKLLVSHQKKIRLVSVNVGTKKIKQFMVNRLPNPTPLQQAILKNWLSE